MSYRRSFLAVAIIMATTLGSSLLVASVAQATGVKPHGVRAGHVSALRNAPATPTAKKYNFCDPGGCPYTEWTVNFATKTFRDSLGDSGTFTHVKKAYAFTFPNLGAKVSCTFDGTKDSTGFSSAADPGTYTCSNGTNSTWWATKT